jgi:hypothetical protein
VVATLIQVTTVWRMWQKRRMNIFRKGVMMWDIISNPAAASILMNKKSCDRNDRSEDEWLTLWCYLV